MASFSEHLEQSGRSMFRDDLFKAVMEVAPFRTVPVQYVQISYVLYSTWYCSYSRNCTLLCRTYPSGAPHFNYFLRLYSDITTEFSSNLKLNFGPRATA